MHQHSDSHTLIGSLRHASTFLRTIAAVVIITFTMWVLAPAAQAARENPVGSPAQSMALSVSDEARLAETLGRIEARLDQMSAGLAAKQDVSAAKAELAALTRRLERLDTRVREGFERTEEHLRKRALPEAILKRHRAMVSCYQSELGTLRESLATIARASYPDQQVPAIKTAYEHLKRHQHRRSQQPFDPNALSTRALRPDPTNQPRTTPEAFRASGLFDRPYTRLAALGDYRLDGLPGAENPAFLAETDEVQLTQLIRDKAAELGHEPVAIYHWVRSEVHWQPGWGAVQAADLTLSARRGNAMDIASLLIALLRASEIPARYVHGTVEVDGQRFRNWASGFSDIDAATNYAAAGGIPLTTVISGGRVDRVQLEHVWVEAAIDYVPSRGAKNRAADAWVALDASFKQYDEQEGLDTLAISGIDAEALAESFTNSGTIDEEVGWVSGLDPSILQAAQEQAQ